MTKTRIDEKVLIYSDLGQKVTANGITVEIVIYRLDDQTTWTLSVYDQEGGDTVWDDLFATEEDALKEAMRAIDEFGITSFAEGRTNKDVH
jgi:hypothetical protein